MHKIKQQTNETKRNQTKYFCLNKKHPPKKPRSDDLFDLSDRFLPVHDLGLSGQIL